MEIYTNVVNILGIGLGCWSLAVAFGILRMIWAVRRGGRYIRKRDLQQSLGLMLFAVVTIVSTLLISTQRELFLVGLIGIVPILFHLTEKLLKNWKQCVSILNRQHS